MPFEDIRKSRIKKLQEVKRTGLDPFPPAAVRTHQIQEVIDTFEELAGKEVSPTLAGRLFTFREHGGLTFGDLRDESGKIQIAFNEDVLKDYRRILNLLDIGDFIEVSGPLFKTKKEEKTLEVRTWRFLVKSLRPLPEKWHGLKDIEERERRRYLDLLFNSEVKEKLDGRCRLTWELRKRLCEEGFLEVETPILQALPGGARARPFVTHHNALDVDFYLRVSPELYLKRLLVGGYEKIFEIGRNFRNEGIDRDHNPEFTMLELYWAYQDYRGLMQFVKQLLGKWFPGSWKTMTFAEAAKSFGGKDYRKIPQEELETFFKKEVRPKIQESTFVIDYPESIMQLAKIKKDDPELTESFQLIAKGTEVVKGFSELNDPIFQRKQMEEQEKLYRAGDQQASRLDEDYLEALEYGMPPAAGLGMGIDRLVMLAADAPSLKEVIPFPTLRPRKE